MCLANAFGEYSAAAIRATVSTNVTRELLRTQMNLINNALVYSIANLANKVESARIFAPFSINKMIYGKTSTLLIQWTLTLYKVERKFIDLRHSRDHKHIKSTHTHTHMWVCKWSRCVQQVRKWSDYYFDYHSMANQTKRLVSIFMTSKIQLKFSRFCHKVAHFGHNQMNVYINILTVYWDQAHYLCLCAYASVCPQITPSDVGRGRNEQS